MALPIFWVHQLQNGDKDVGQSHGVVRFFLTKEDRSHGRSNPQKAALQPLAKVTQVQTHVPVLRDSGPLVLLGQSRGVVGLFLTRQ